MLTHRLAEDAELRALEPWNAEEFAQHVDRVREYIGPWVGFTHLVTDPESARDVLQRYADKQAKDEGRIYGIWVDDKLMGGTLFRTFDARTGVCEIGVWLDPAMVGRGLITTAAKYMIEWAVCARGMSRVEWLCDPANERSSAVAQRLGMTLEGVHRSASVIGGKRHDYQVWSVLDTEWRAQK